jgi:hypothetical protein
MMAHKWKDILGKRDMKNKALVNVILDKSGSMSMDTDNVIGAFNSFFDEFKKDSNVDYKVTLTLFDTQVYIPYSNKPIGEMPKLDRRVYDPSGMTALYDAIGKTITEIGEADKDTKVFVIILTDGQENSSIEYRKETIKSLIEQKDALPNWTFTFLGTGIDAWAAGGSIGIGIDNTASWAGGVTVSGATRNLVRSVSYYANVSMDTFTTEKNAYFKGTTDLSDGDAWQVDKENK